MVSPAQTVQSTVQASHYGRIAPAGARGASTVDRDSQIEESSQNYTYDPDEDGILFNAYIDGKKHNQSHQEKSGGQPDQRSEQSNVSPARRASDREGAVDPDTDVNFASLLDPSIPFDLSANSGPSFYAVVNAVVHGSGVRGTHLDTTI
ncbi:hypothetical protein LPB41_12860 [Thalassospira sp. MA62]|nr:hypothetical protein [Thalassospira sp. MA62]